MSRQICYIQYYFILLLLLSLVISISIIITNYYLYHNNIHIISTYLYVLNRAHSSLPSISQRTVHVLCVTTINLSYLIYLFLNNMPTYLLLSSLVIITDYYLYHSHILSTYLYSTMHSHLLLE